MPLPPHSPPLPGSAFASVARAAFWTLTALALPACLLTTAAWFTSEPAFLAQLSPFRIQALVLLVAHLVFCLALRRLRWAAVFAAFALFNLAVLLHGARAFHSPLATNLSPTPAIKILYANILTSNTDPARLLALIASEQPDLVALLEINARWRSQLEPALAADYPHHFVRTREDNFGLAIFSRVQPAGGHVEFFADVETPSFDFTWPHPDGDIRILLTHPLPPGTRTATALRDQHLGDLVNWHRFVSGLAAPGVPSAPILILGDLNATPWCPPLRRLLAATGLRPAANDHGLLAPTWPVPVPFLRIPLDHALLSPHLACPRYRVGPDIGSDHYPLLLEVRPAP